MLLAIDVGNTHTVIGLYQGDDLKEHLRLETKKERTADELGILLRELFRAADQDINVDGIIISNVVPPLQHALDRMGERYFKIKPLFVDHVTDTGIRIKLEHPQEVGADRIVNAVGAHDHVQGEAVIVVDLGTATTFDYITEQGEYLGGAIAPGILSSNEALAQNASRLPRSDIRKPDSSIGNNTLECMQAGLYFGYVGLLDGLVERMKQEKKSSARVIATGGLAGLLSQEAKSIDEVLPNLTLDGLRLIWNRVKT